MDKKESEMTMMVKGYCGIGDHVNERPFVLDAAKRYKAVYLETAFPDLFYAGIPNVICLPRTHIVQSVIDRIASCKARGLYGKPLGQYDKIVKLSYGYEIKTKNLSILEAFNTQLPHSDFANISIALPKNPEWEAQAREFVVGRDNVCLVKLPTFRYEHSRDVDYSSRNPKMEYIAKAIKAAKKAGYFVVSTADISGYKERFDGKMPDGIDLRLHDGELPTTAVLGMHSIAKKIIAIPSSSLHLGVAYNVPTLAIFGGFSEPRIYTSPLKTPNLTTIAPKAVCNCFDIAHRCDKNIDEDVLNAGIEKFFGVSLTKDDFPVYKDEKDRPFRLVIRHGVERKLYL